MPREPVETKTLPARFDLSDPFFFSNPKAIQMPQGVAPLFQPITHRAAKLLVNRTNEEIQNAIFTINWMLQDFEYTPLEVTPYQGADNLYDYLDRD